MDDGELTISINLSTQDFVEAHAFLAGINLPARMPPEQRRGQIALNYLMDLVRDGIEVALKAHENMPVEALTLATDGVNPAGGSALPPIEGDAYVASGGVQLTEAQRRGLA